MSEPKDHLSISIDTQLQYVPDSPYKPSIFRVSDDLRCVDEKLYKPNVVAIGPFYHSYIPLQKMEQHKFRYLKLLLKRRKESSVDKYVMAIRSLEEKARGCYAEPIYLNRDDFVHMLLLDGIFIIELIRKYLFYEWREPDDTIFQHEQVYSQLFHDLLLLENQVPFFVLDQLFSMTKSGNPDDDILYLIHVFADYISPWPDAYENAGEVSMENIDHLLGLVYRIWCSSFKMTASRPCETEDDRIYCCSLIWWCSSLIWCCSSLIWWCCLIWCCSFAKMTASTPDQHLAISCTTELQEAGIKFLHTECHCWDIKFTKAGVMKIPRFLVKVATESVLRNLIAYEHFVIAKHPKYVTYYAFFWDCLINSSKDVEILRRHGIVTHLLGDDEMVCRMFNRLGRNTIPSYDFCYRDVFTMVHEHCGYRSNRWMANLRHNYFNSPWAFISFFAALMLLVFTLTQTVFSVLSYPKF